MVNLSLLALLCALGVHAAPAPQDSSIASVPAPDLSKHNTCSEDGSGIYVGDVIQACPEGTRCVNNICDSTTNPYGGGGATSAGAGSGEAAGAGSASGAAVSSNAVNAVASAGVVGGSAASQDTNGGGAAGGAAGGTAGGAAGEVSAYSQSSYGAPSSAASGVPTAAGSTGSAGTSGASGSSGGSGAASGLENGQFKMSAPECPGRDASEEFRYVGYWAQFYDGENTPSPEQFDGITHVVLAFAEADGYGWAMVDKNAGLGPTFGEQTVSGVRAVVGDSVKIMAAFGGWGQDQAFGIAAASGSMEDIANNMIEFVNKQGLDGIDLDWEYPVNYGADYKKTGSVQQDKTYEKDAYVELMRLLRQKAPDIVLSAAVPAIEHDTVAFTQESVPQMDACLDFWNLMTYDYVNRRSGKSWHHQGGAVIEEVIKLYKEKGVPDKKINFGYGTYAKWWIVAGTCSPDSPLDCDLALGEDNVGVGTANSGVWKWNAMTNDKPDPSIQATIPQLLALGDSASDESAQASAWVDSQNRFWSWLTAKNVADSCAKHSGSAGGVFFWSMNGDDAGLAGGSQIKAMAQCAKNARRGGGSG